MLSSLDMYIFKKVSIIRHVHLSLVVRFTKKKKNEKVAKYISNDCHVSKHVVAVSMLVILDMSGCTWVAAFKTKKLKMSKKYIHVSGLVPGGLAHDNGTTSKGSPASGC